MLSATITRRVHEDGRGAVDLRLIEEGPVTVHEHGWLPSPGGTQHFVDELEAACRRIGISEVNVENGPVAA